MIYDKIQQIKANDDLVNYIINYFIPVFLVIILFKVTVADEYNFSWFKNMTFVKIKYKY